MELLNLLYPRTCVICGKVLGKEKICKDCRRELSYCKSPRCCCCGKQLETLEQEYCGDCQKKPHLFRRGLAPFSHVGKIRHAVYGIKYQNQRENIDFFVEEINRHYRKEIGTWNCDIMIPVPLYYKKKRKRGFNQAEVFAKRLSKKLNMSCQTDILVRNRETRPLKELSRKARMENLQGAFTVKKQCVRGKTILLVDDIYTTGSTLDACSAVLRRAGAKEIYFVCMTIGTGM